MTLAIDRSWTTSLAIATTLILSGTAGASDGVIEINQTCATSTGCVANDSAGFPVFIGGFNAPRNYVLTSDLVPTNTGSVLFIDGNNVNLDMNGFSILCSPSSTFGIRFASPQRNLRVSNGTISGCLSGGIGGGGSFANTGDGARIQGLNIDSCTDGGIDVGENSIVEDSVVSGSGLTQVGTSPTFSGIRIGPNSIARNNAVRGAVIGINCDGNGGCVISGNVARVNTDGISGRASTIINNTSTENSDDGIAASQGSYVIGNTIRNNSTGLDLSSDTSYRGNSITGGSGSITIQGGIGVNQGQNTCVVSGALSACP